MQTKTQALQDLLERQGQPPQVGPPLPLMMDHIHDRWEQQVLASASEAIPSSAGAAG